jgi:hypothetical protein
VGGRNSQGRLGVLIFKLIEGFTILALSQIADSVGMEDLSMTFDELIGNRSNTSYRFIDVSVRLYHFRAFPEDQEFDPYGEVRKHPFGSQVLMRLVWLFSTCSQLRATYCKESAITSAFQSGALSSAIPDQNCCLDNLKYGTIHL